VVWVGNTGTMEHHPLHPCSRAVELSKASPQHRGLKCRELKQLSLFSGTTEASAVVTCAWGWRTASASHSWRPRAVTDSDFTTVVALFRHMKDWLTLHLLLHSSFRQAIISLLIKATFACTSGMKEDHGSLW